MYVLYVVKRPTNNVFVLKNRTKLSNISSSYIQTRNGKHLVSSLWGMLEVMISNQERKSKFYIFITRKKIKLPRTHPKEENVKLFWA